MTIIVMLAVISAIVVVSQTFVTLAGLQIPTILTDMPTFHEYDDAGKLAIDSDTGEPKVTGYLKFYWFLAQFSVVILALAVGISVMEYVLSGTGLADVGKAVERVKKAVPFMVVILVLPTVWDPFAILVEETALFLMAPFPEDRTDIGLAGLVVDESTLQGRAAARSAWLWMEAGHIRPPSAWQAEGIAEFAVDPDKVVQEIISQAFLSVFKAYVVIILGIEMWVTGVLRIVITMITLIAIPILLPMTLIPKFDEHAHRLVNGMFGLIMAPILSAIIFTAGVAYLQSSFDQPALIRWLSAVCVCFLCSSAVTSVGGGLLMTSKSDVMGAMKTAMNAAAMTVSAAATGGLGGAAGIGTAAGGMATGAASGMASGMTGGMAGGAGISVSAGQASNLGGSSQPRPVGTGGMVMPPASAGPQSAGTATPSVTGGRVPGIMPAPVGIESGSSSPPPRPSGVVISDATDVPDEQSGEHDANNRKEEKDKPRKASPTFWDRAGAFGLGAMTGMAGPMMQGSLPSEYGIGSITDSLSSQAKNLGERFQREHHAPFAAAAEMDARRDAAARTAAAQAAEEQADKKDTEYVRDRTGTMFA